MAVADPLERAVWSALTSRQSALALTEGAARRFAPDYGPFAAVADTCADSLASLAALVRAHGDAALLELGEPPPAPGLAITSVADAVQMVADGPAPASRASFRIEPLSEADAPQMRALAALTRPGPFGKRTHQLGDFVGVKARGRLIAMAGERMKLPGYTEVSGVCTHPDHRGQGYAAALTLQVMAAIRARGDTPFLHAYAANAGAIALYESLGFSVSRRLVMTSLTVDADARA